jgi:hypothetical protein
VSNGGNTANNPTIYTQGVMITQGKYMIISGIFADTTLAIVMTAVWRYHITGTMGYFVDHEIMVRT